MLCLHNRQLKRRQQEIEVEQNKTKAYRQT